jgi:amino acid transporter
MAEGTGGGLKRDAGIIGLLFASLGGIVGSGWLFGPLNAAKIAGPAAIIAWVIGGFAVLLLSFVYAELTTAFPRAGAVIAFPKLSHGSLMAVVMSWIVFLGYVSVPPVEAEGVVTYVNNYYPGLVNSSTSILTHEGFLAALLLMAIFVVINTLAIRTVLRINAAITWWKLAIPAITVIALIIAGFHPANFTSHGFAPTGLPGILSAVATSGVVFAYLGFRQAIELAGESSNPKRNLPIAVVGSVLIGILLYIGLQVAFIGALSPSDLAKGWANLTFTGVTGPFAGLATLLGLTWLSVLLYIDAFVSPGGTGIIYFTTSSRVIYATGKEGLMSAKLTKVSLAGVPVIGLVITFVIGVLFLLPFPSWQKLVGFISSATVLSYGIGPVVLLTLRKTVPASEFPRPFLLQAPWLVAGAAFIISNFIVFWSGVPTDNYLFGGLAALFIIYLAYEAVFGGGLAIMHWAGAWWMLPYFAGLWLLTYLGPNALTGGTSTLSDITASILLIVFSIAILILAVNCGVPDPVEAKATLLAGEPQLYEPAE